LFGASLSFYVVGDCLRLPVAMNVWYGGIVVWMCLRVCYR